MKSKKRKFGNLMRHKIFGLTSLSMGKYLMHMAEGENLKDQDMIPLSVKIEINALRNLLHQSSKASKELLNKKYFENLAALEMAFSVE